MPITKIASSRRQMAGLRPNLHMMVSRSARIQDVLKVKVKVKGHVIGHFRDDTKITSSCRQMAGLRPNLHTMISRSACIQGVLKVDQGAGHVTYMICTKIASSSTLMAAS